MNRRCFVWFTLVAVMFGIIPNAHAQVSTATLSGTVIDESKGVLPGANVTATDLATGRTYSAVTDARGEYRLVNMAPGLYKVHIELSGFATTEFPQVELLVGQSVSLPVSLKVAALAETLTVSGEAPLINTRSSQVAGNVDRRQMEDLPLQGRNWLQLATLIKGITSNNIGETPGVSHQNMFQLNIDGQQVTSKLGEAGFGQPRFSREAIAEFQIVTNLFDITQGRSVGVQVQAITKAGTNKRAGAAFSNFRSDRFNAADPIARRVLPYSNQQAGGSIGGPIVRDKLHFFGSYEYEREPSTVISQPTFLPGQIFTFDTKKTTNLYLARVDYQMGKQDHLSARWTRSNFDSPLGSLGPTTHPSQAGPETMDSNNVLATWSRVYGGNKAAELRVGYNGFNFWNGVPQELYGFMQLEFPGLTIGPQYNRINASWQDTYSARYDLSWFRGNHSFKIGGEYLRVHDTGIWELNRTGRMIFNSRPPDLVRRFPADAWNDVSRWDLTGLNPYVQRLDQAFHKAGWRNDVPRPTWAIWFGDTWTLSDRLTVNAGVRWDDDWGALSPPGVTESHIPINNGYEQGDFGYTTGKRDNNNVAPRAGFAYKVGAGDDLVIRGGTGLYYTFFTTNITNGNQLFSQAVSASFLYDGRPEFVLDPRRGLTSDDILSGRVPLPPQALRILAPDFEMPYTWQNAIGFQKQLGPVMAFDSDLVHWIWYHDTRTYDPNLFYDPVNGYSKDPAVFGRPNPTYGQITWFESTGKRDYLALTNSFTRRLKGNFQGGATYTLMFYMHDNGSVGFTGGPADNNFDHLDGEWARSTDFQRHTVRTYALYKLPWQFSISGMYSFGSANYYSTSHSSRPFGKLGTNRLNLGPPVVIPENVRDRFDGPSVIETGGVVPRNALVGQPIHKVDVRVAKDIVLSG
ncbi:MAG TPA: TonB-dependent receptor, partial [Vicinamibacterales bacterium]|nr:TonB-dependent receptor [Vicinamibacterales bacterium]